MGSIAPCVHRDAIQTREIPQNCATYHSIWSRNAGFRTGFWCDLLRQRLHIACFVICVCVCACVHVIILRVSGSWHGGRHLHVDGEGTDLPFRDDALRLNRKQRATPRMGLEEIDGGLSEASNSTQKSQHRLGISFGVV